MSVPHITDHLPDGFYRLINTEQPQDACLVRLYAHPDFDGVRHIGFGIWDGGGAIPVTDLTPNSVLQRLTRYTDGPGTDDICELVSHTTLGLAPVIETEILPELNQLVQLIFNDGSTVAARRVASAMFHRQWCWVTPTKYISPDDPVVIDWDVNVLASNAIDALTSPSLIQKGSVEDWMEDEGTE